MLPRGNPFQIGLASGNWRPPQTWEGRVSNFTLLKWILWDPYALRAYALLYAGARWPRVVRQWRLRQGDPKAPVSISFTDSELPYRPLVYDILGVIYLVWATTLVTVLVVGVYVGASFPMIIGFLVVSFFALGVAAVVTFGVSALTFQHAAAGLWGLVVAVGLPLIAAGEIWLWNGSETPRELALVATWLAIAIVLGMTLAGTVHLLEREGKLFPATRLAVMAWGGIALGASMWFIFGAPWLFARPSLDDVLPQWRLALYLVSALVVMWLSYCRLLDWVIFGLRAQTPDKDGSWTIPRTTRFGVPAVTREVRGQTATNLQKLIDEFWYLWGYSRQRSFIRRYVTRPDAAFVATTSGLEQLARFYDSAYPWRSFDFYSEISWLGKLRFFLAWLAGSVDSLNTQSVFDLDYLASAYRRVPRDVLDHPIDNRQPLVERKNGMRALHLLEQGRFPEAEVRFSELSPDPLAAELQAITQHLQAFQDFVANRMVSACPVVNEPANAQRGATWNALRELRTAMFYLWLRQRTQGVNGQRAVLDLATQQIDSVIRRRLPQPEGNRIHIMARTWDNRVRAWRAATFGTDPSALLPVASVENPYRKMRDGNGLRLPLIERNASLVPLLESLDTPDEGPILLHSLPMGGVTTALYALAQQRTVAMVQMGQFVDTAKLGVDFARALLDALATSYETAPIPDDEDDDVNLSRTLGRVLYGLNRRSGQSAIIVLDELDLVWHALDGANSVKSQLQTLFGQIGRLPNLDLIMAGHFTPSQSDVISRQFPNVTRQTVPPFDYEDIEALYQNAGTDTDTWVTDGTASYVLERTGGHPYLVWLIGDSLIEQFNAEIRAIGRSDPVFTVNSVQSVLRSPRVTRRARPVFNRDIDLARREDPQLVWLLRQLALLAATGAPVSIEQLMAVPVLTGTLNNQELRHSLDHLVILGLLRAPDPDTPNGEWQFTVPMFLDYVLGRPYAQ